MHTHIGPVHRSMTKHPRSRLNRHCLIWAHQCPALKVLQTSVIIITPDSAHHQMADKTHHYLGRAHDPFGRMFHGTIPTQSSMRAWEYVLLISLSWRIPLLYCATVQYPEQSLSLMYINHTSSTEGLWNSPQQDMIHQSP